MASTPFPITRSASAGSLCWFEEGTTDSRPKELSKVTCLGFLKGSHCPHYDAEPGRRPLYHKLIASGEMPVTIAVCIFPGTTDGHQVGGGDNGHNGLRSVTRALGTREYNRVRVGIGRPAGRQDPADYVLSNFGSAERKELPLVTELAADAVEALLRSGLAAAQNQIHAL